MARFATQTLQRPTLGTVMSTCGPEGGQGGPRASPRGRRVNSGFPGRRAVWFW